MLGSDERDIGNDARARITAGDQRLDAAIVVGDLDGDGVADAIVVAHYREGGPTLGQELVQLYVVYGGDLTGDIDVAALPTLLAGPFGPYMQVTPVGDVDGDGFADVLLAHCASGCGSRDPSAPDDTRHTGAFLLYGRPARLTGASWLPAVAARLRDPDPCPIPGIAAVGLGDIDGDGKHDFAIGSGKNAFVFYGRSDRLSGTVDLQAVADASLDLYTCGYPEPGDIVAAGDVDGDGRDDFVAAGSACDGTQFRGLVRGSAVRLAGTHTVGEIASTRFVGDALCPWNAAVPLGDLDGDGKADLAMFSCSNLTGYDYVFLYHLFYGRSGGFPATVDLGAADATIRGSSILSLSGLVMDSADLDGNGSREVIFGDDTVAGSDGAVYVLYGRGTRWSGNVDLGRTATVYRGGSHDGLGAAISVGDVTGDGRADLLVTAPSQRAEAPTLGVRGSSDSKVYVVSPAMAPRR